MAFLGCDVAGKALGVVGMGSIGGESRARARLQDGDALLQPGLAAEAVERELKATWVRGSRTCSRAATSSSSSAR
ncbi:hydroxypyruvate reductase [Aureococcus anophagefferens]|nr:hydroxypyruvate reductase [Aureococcus anophagefferens]